MTALPSATNIELEFLNPENPLNGNQTFMATFKESRSTFFALFNQTPTKALYPGTNEADSLTMLLIKLFYKLHGEEFPKATNKTQASQMLQKMCKMSLSQTEQLVTRE